MVARVLEQLPHRVTAALHGDREALVTLLRAATDAARQPAGGAPGSVEAVAVSAHRFADAVADCYSADRAPSGWMCDLGFTLADRVEALVVEVLQRRADAGVGDHAVLSPPGPAPAREARHLARAHLAALRDAAAERRVVAEPDAEAARDLYRAIVALGRQHTGRSVRAALAAPPSPPAPPVPPPRLGRGRRTCGRPTSDSGLVAWRATQRLGSPAR
jgi:hypothetical protein